MMMTRWNEKPIAMGGVGLAVGPLLSAARPENPVQLTGSFGVIQLKGVGRY